MEQQGDRHGCEHTLAAKQSEDVVTAAVAVVAAGIAGGLFWRGRQARRLREKTPSLSGLRHSTGHQYSTGRCEKAFFQLDQSPS